ncbi:hypothetical protein HDU91_003381, partial [Kappamyces sp. JEL0680]
MTPSRAWRTRRLICRCQLPISGQGSFRSSTVWLFICSIVSGTKNIEQFLKSEKKVLDKYREEPKLLLLGSSDSGKSTLLKQLKIMHGGGFSDKEKKSLAKRIQSDVLFTVCECISELSDFEDKDLKKKYSNILEFHQEWSAGRETKFTPHILESLAAAWQESRIQQFFEESQHMIPESNA